MPDEVDDDLIMPERREEDEDTVLFRAKQFLSRLLHRKKRQEETKQEVPVIAPPNPQQNVPKIQHNVSQLDTAKKQLEGLMQKPAEKPKTQIPVAAQVSAQTEKYLKARKIINEYKKKR